LFKLSAAGRTSTYRRASSQSNAREAFCRNKMDSLFFSRREAQLLDCLLRLRSVVAGSLAVLCRRAAIRSTVHIVKCHIGTEAMSACPACLAKAAVVETRVRGGREQAARAAAVIVNCPEQTRHALVTVGIAQYA